MTIALKTFPQSGIVFDDYKTIEGATRFYITPKGNFPSMTSMLSILDDGGLDVWRERVGEDAANKICSDAANRGQDLHDYSELYLKNELKRENMKGAGRQLFLKSKKHLDKIEKVIGTEVALYSEYLEYAGRCDCICEIFGKNTILDHKNSKKPINLNLGYARRKLFKYMLQCTGYSLALEERKGIQARQGVLVVSNFETFGSDLFRFDIDDFLIDEFFKLVKSYKSGEGDCKESYFYSL